MNTTETRTFHTELCRSLNLADLLCWADADGFGECVKEGTPADLKWVTCSKEVNVTVGEYKHLIPMKGITTLCGSTGMGDGVWRRNSAKPACPSCLKRLYMVSA